MATSRETVRDYFATLLYAALVDPGPKVVQKVYNYRKADIEGESPVVLVYSGGSLRSKATIAPGGVQTAMRLWVQIAVAARGAAGYTEADAEDLIDSIEAKIAQVLADNSSAAGYWVSILQPEVSIIEDVVIGGNPYTREFIPVDFSVWG